MQDANQFHSDLSKDLCRLASFGANIADAFSCFIFLPTRVLFADQMSTEKQTLSEISPTGSSDSPISLALSGVHSLSNDLVPHPVLSAESGLIGWVARHNRSIHVSPFERDSRTLGTYTRDQDLKSFIGIPATLNLEDLAQFPITPDTGQKAVGVIACDSKKSFAFSKLQGKLLEGLAYEVASTVRLRLLASNRQRPEESWGEFLRKADLAARAIGHSSVEVLRVRVLDFCDYEMSQGTDRALKGLSQMYRLFQQILPDSTPAYRLPDGSMVAVLDSMMGAYYENRMKATCDHVFGQSVFGQSVFGQSTVSGSRAAGASGPNIEFRRLSFRDRECRGFSLDQLIAATANTFLKNNSSKGNSDYEYRRA